VNRDSAVPGASVVSLLEKVFSRGLGEWGGGRKRLGKGKKVLGQREKCHQKKFQQASQACCPWTASGVI